MTTRVLGRHREPALTSVRHAGLLLPPPSQRRCTEHFADDAYFLETARREVRRLRERLGLSPGGTLLDIGCGPGRLALGLIAEMRSIARYEGVDVATRSVDWCRAHITAEHPSFRFTHLDIHNDRYNPGGGIVLDESFRFPFESGSFDIVYLYSVFTHMLERDVVIYLREFRRILRPDGGVFLTAYLEHDVAPVTVNPPEYGGSAGGPLLRVRYDLNHFEAMARDAGMTIDRLDHAAEFDGQSGVYLRVA